MWRWFRWLLLFLGLLAAVIVSFIIYLLDFRFTKNDRENPLRFIEADFIDLSKVSSFSKYRSGIGHSTDDSVEKCRSLRHIFGGKGKEEYATAEEKWEKLRFPPEESDSINIFSPVNGRVIDLSGRRYEDKSGFGQTIVIKPDNVPGYKVRIDSIFLDSAIKPLMKLKAGQKIGVVCTQCPAEIYVYYSYIGGERSVSYISALSDKVFASYQARGLKTREEAVIPQQYRDAHPFTCEPKDAPTSPILDHPEMHDMKASFVVLNDL